MNKQLMLYPSLDSAFQISLFRRSMAARYHNGRLLSDFKLSTKAAGKLISDVIKAGPLWPKVAEIPHFGHCSVAEY